MLNNLWLIHSNIFSGYPLTDMQTFIILSFIIIFVVSALVLRLPTTSISGKCLKADGTPEAGVSIVAKTDETTIIAQATSDAEGNYTISVTGVSALRLAAHKPNLDGSWLEGVADVLIPPGVSVLVVDIPLVRH